MSRRFLPRLLGRREDDPARKALKERRRELLRALVVEDRFRQELAALSPRARVAFATASAERLLPTYERFSEEDSWGDPSVLRDGLDAVWDFLRRDGDVPPAARFRERVEAIAPDDTGDVKWKSRWSSDSLDAVIAAVNVVEAVEERTVEKAARAVQYEINTIEAHIDEALPERFAAGDPLESEIDLLQHETDDPLMQETIALLAADLDDLSSAEAPSRETLRHIRERARERSVPTRVEASRPQ